MENNNLIQTNCINDDKMMFNQKFDDQDYKMKINYIVNEKTSPVKIFGGIFSTFSTDKENVKYYNFLEYHQNSNTHNNRNLSINNRVQVESSNESIPLQSLNEQDQNKEKLRRILLKKLK